MGALFWRTGFSTNIGSCCAGDTGARAGAGMGSEVGPIEPGMCEACDACGACEGCVPIVSVILFIAGVEDNCRQDADCDGSNVVFADKLASKD